MEEFVLSVPKKDRRFMETLASRMGWQLRTRRSSVEKFIQSCPTSPVMTDEEIAAEVNAVRYGAWRSCLTPICGFHSWSASDYLRLRMYCVVTIFRYKWVNNCWVRFVMLYHVPNSTSLFQLKPATFSLRWWMMCVSWPTSQLRQNLQYVTSKIFIYCQWQKVFRLTLLLAGIKTWQTWAPMLEFRYLNTQNS